MGRAITILIILLMTVNLVPAAHTVSLGVWADFVGRRIWGMGLLSVDGLAEIEDYGFTVIASFSAVCSDIFFSNSLSISISGCFGFSL